jgi:hypothetical protein
VLLAAGDGVPDDESPLWRVLVLEVDQHARGRGGSRGRPSCCSWPRACERGRWWRSRGRIAWMSLCSSGSGCSRAAAYFHGSRGSGAGSNPGRRGRDARPCRPGWRVLGARAHPRGGAQGSLGRAPPAAKTPGTCRRRWLGLDLDACYGTDRRNWNDVTYLRRIGIAIYGHKNLSNKYEVCRSRDKAIDRACLRVEDGRRHDRGLTRTRIPTNALMMISGSSEWSKTIDPSIRLRWLLHDVSKGWISTLMKNNFVVLAPRRRLTQMGPPLQHISVPNIIYKYIIIIIIIFLYFFNSHPTQRAIMINMELKFYIIFPSILKTSNVKTQNYKVVDLIERQL